MNTNREQALRRRIQSRMKLYDISPENISIKMRMSERSWFRRMQKPGTLTVEELERLERILHTELLQLDAEA